VERDYDLFEVFPDHTVRWRVCVHGTRSALAKLHALAKQTDNECFAADISTQEVIGRVNQGRATAEILDDWSSAN
jgi:hypothetical protein